MRTRIEWAILAVLSLSLTATVAPAATDPLAELAAEYKKRGEPIERVDFEVKGVADSDNAALELRKAADAFKDESDAWTQYDALPSVTPPLNEAQVMVLQKIALENFETIKHVDAAMTRKGVDWQIKVTSPVIEVLLPHLNKQRALARMLEADALLMHHQGSHGQALRDVQRMMFISRAVDQQGFVVGHMVSIANMSQACGLLEKLTPDLKIGTGPAALEQQVKDVIAQLLDDGPPRKGLRLALYSERMAGYDICGAVADGRLTPARLAQLASGNNNPAPAIRVSSEEARADGVLMMRYATQILAAADAAKNWPAQKANFPRRPKELDAKGGPRHVLARMMLPALERAIFTHYRSATDRRLAAVALAIRAYAVANGEKMPGQLSDLAPKYLPAVPDDPMTNGQPLRYDAARMIVYSVGEDGKDDGGSEKAMAKTKSVGRWQGIDAVLHLKRQPRNDAP